MKTDKPDVESKSDEKCEKPLPNDSSNLKEKVHYFNKEEKSVSQEFSFKTWEKKSQSLEKGVGNSKLESEISKTKARKKAYWKKQKEIQKAKFLKQNNSHIPEKKFSQT